MALTLLPSNPHQLFFHAGPLRITAEHTHCDYSQGESPGTDTTAISEPMNKRQRSNGLEGPRRSLPQAPSKKSFASVVAGHCVSLGGSSPFSEQGPSQSYPFGAPRAQARDRTGLVHSKGGRLGSRGWASCLSVRGSSLQRQSYTPSFNWYPQVLMPFACPEAPGSSV